MHHVLESLVRNGVEGEDGEHAQSQGLGPSPTITREWGGVGVEGYTASAHRGFAPQARTCASFPMPICRKADLGIGDGMPPRKEGYGRQNVCQGESRTRVECD
jgi:hypothetical protein